MKWIFTFFIFFSFNSSAVESTPAYQAKTWGQCFGGSNLVQLSSYVTIEQCLVLVKNHIDSPTRIPSIVPPIQYQSGGQTNITCTNPPYANFGCGQFRNVYLSSAPTTCPPPDKPDFTIGPVDLNGSKVCQKPPKVCLKGAIVRVTSDGKETCVPNCGSAAGLAHSGQYFYQAGPDAGSTAGQVTCYGQCAIQTIGGGVQLSSGAWTGSFTFTGANCSVVRPEPTLDSEDDTSSNGDAPPVDNSNTSQDTEDALDDLQGAASGATGTQVQPDATGPNGETTLKDIAKVVADSANAQIKATSEQNVATGKLVSNISKDIQNAIHNSGHGGGGASASLQAQGNGKLDTISDKLGEISDKLDDEKEETPFVPPADSAPFWENVLPDSAFTSIKDKKDSSIQELKDLQSEFSSGLFQTDLTVSGQRPEYDITFNGQNFSAGTFVFDLLLNSGLSAIIFLIATLTAIYIITTRSK
ncbi:TPA: hypothetical protein ACSP48_000525 [Aeromonas veronii]